MCSYALQRRDDTTTSSTKDNSVSSEHASRIASRSSDELVSYNTEQSQAEHSPIASPDVAQQIWQGSSASTSGARASSTVHEPTSNPILGITENWTAAEETDGRRGAAGKSHMGQLPTEFIPHNPDAGTIRHHVCYSSFASPEQYRQRPTEREQLHTLAGTFGAQTAVSMNSNVETATARWLGLLIGDVAPENGVLPGLDFEDTGVDIFGNSIATTPGSDVCRVRVVGVSETALTPSSNPFLQERLMKLGGDQVLERQAWHSNESLKLLPPEEELFRTFVKRISCWVSIRDTCIYQRTKKISDTIASDGPLRSQKAFWNICTAFSCKWITWAPYFHLMVLNLGDA